MAYREYNNNRRIPLLGAEDNALTWLVTINLIMFVILNFIKIVYFLSNLPEEFFFRQVLTWFTLPGSFETLFHKPWVLITYMFSHLDVWQLISTLLWLWGFGYILQDLTGNSKLLPIYIYGGLAGGLAFLISINLIPALWHHNGSLQMLGGSVAVMAVAVATTTLAPDYRVFPMINGGIPLWVLTLIFVAIDFATIASLNGGTALAHLISGASGFFFIKQSQKGNDLGAWMFRALEWFDGLLDPSQKSKIKEKPRKQEVFYNADRPPYTKTTTGKQQKLDDILDKINQEGYDKLSKEEKDFLKRVSNEDL